MKKLEEIYNKMKDINYGYVDKGKNIYPSDLENWNINFSKLYRLQSPEELLKNKYGVCWDQVELERYYLEQEHINFSSYFIIAHDNKKEPTHTFIVIEDNNKYYWLEHSWSLYKGIYEYNTLNELFSDVIVKFKNSMVKEQVADCDIAIYKYKRPKYGLNCIEFMNYCENGEKMDIYML